MSVNNVGKKVNLAPMQQSESKDFKGGLRLDKFGEGVTDKDKSLFAAIDKNNDGVITQEELADFFSGETPRAGIDRNTDGTVTQREAKKFIKNNQNLQELQIDKKDLLAFLNKAGQASEDIKSCTLNDQNQVVVTYNDGSTDTINSDRTRINERTDATGDKYQTVFSAGGKKIKEQVIGEVIGQIDTCTTTTLYEEDGTTVKSITVTDSQGREISKTEGNTVTNTTYSESGEIYENVIVDGKLTKTTVKDEANNKTTVIEYDTEVDSDGNLYQKTRSETVGNETKTWTYQKGIQSTLTIKKGTRTELYEYDETGTKANHVSTDVDKGHGIIEHSAFSTQNGKDVTTVSINGKNQSQSVFGASGKVARKIEYTDAPNGERATVVIIQDQESIAQICNKFGMTQDEFQALNEGNSAGLRGTVGAKVNVKGELEVTDSRFDGRLSSEGAIKAKNQRIYREQVRTAQGIANRRQEVLMLVSRDKKYNGSWENVARDLYQIEGNTQYSKIDLRVRAQQLQKLNPGVTTFEYGSTVLRVAIDPGTYESSDNIRKTANGSDATGVVNLGGQKMHAWNIALRACQATENNVARPLTPMQQGLRAKKIIELNPGVFDKNGKMINPPADGKIKVPVGYTEAYRNRQAKAQAKHDNQYYIAAEQIYRTAVDKSGNSSISTMRTQMGSLTSEHIVQFYQSYNTYIQHSKGAGAQAWGREHGVTYTTHGAFGDTWMGSDDTSIYDTICSETGASQQERKDLCTDIFNRIAKAAEDAGVEQADIVLARGNFLSSMNAQFNATGTVSTTKMEQTTEWLIGKIHEAKTGANKIDDKTAQDAFTGMYEQQVNSAQASFDQNMENVSWVGTFSTWLVDKVSDTTTVGEMEDKLKLQHGSLEQLKNCKTQEEFNTKYKQIFGVDFNAQNIATVMQLQQNLQTIAQDQAEIEGITQSFNIIARSNSLSDYENWVTAGITDPGEKASTLEAIYSQFGGVDNISQLSEAEKMNAIRKAKDAEIAAINADITRLKGGKTIEQLQENLETTANASFGTNNNIVKEVTKFNSNINRTEAIGNVVMEIGVSVIPVGRVLSLAGKGIRLANGAYKGYRTTKAVTTAVRATEATTTAARATQVTADAARATQIATDGASVTNRVRNVISTVAHDQTVRQAAQAGFNTGVFDYSKYGDVEHAIEHGTETAVMFAVGGGASRTSQAITRELEITSTAGKWAMEAGITGSADLTAAYASTRLIHGQDLTTQDGMMTFGMDAAFALLGMRGTRTRAKAHTTSEPSVLSTATNDGTRVSGGKFGDNKFATARNQAQHVSVDDAPAMYQQAGLHRATNRTQGRTLENDVLDAMGIRREGKKLTADTPEGQEVVRRVSEQIDQDASAILGANAHGELPPHDAATLDAHLANNCNTKAEVEQFIKDLKKRIGTDTNGNLLSYIAADGVDHGAFVLRNAERKLKSLGDFDDAMKTIPAEGGMADLATVRAFMGRADATSEQLESLLNAMQANPQIAKFSGARKLMADLKDQIEVRKTESMLSNIGEGNLNTAPQHVTTSEGTIAGASETYVDPHHITTDGTHATGDINAKTNTDAFGGTSIKSDRTTHSNSEPTVAPEPKPTVAPEPKPTVAPEPKPTVAPEPKPTVAPEPKPTVAPKPNDAQQITMTKMQSTFAQKNTISAEELSNMEKQLANIPDCAEKTALMERISAKRKELATNPASHFDGIDDSQLVADYNKVNKEWQRLRQNGDASQTMQSLRERRDAYIKEIRQRGIHVEDDGFGYFEIKPKNDASGTTATSQQHVQPPKANQQQTINQQMQNLETTMQHNGFSAAGSRQVTGGTEVTYIKASTGERCIVKIDANGKATTVANDFLPVSQMTPAQRKASFQQRAQRQDMDLDELCRERGNGGRTLPENYISNSKEIRQHFLDAMETGEYLASPQSYIRTMNRGHELAFAGSNGTSYYYNKNGHLARPDEINPGEIMGAYVHPSNARVEESQFVESIARKYGDEYTLDKASSVKLPGISREALPENLNGRHWYAPGTHYSEYFGEMYRTAKNCMNLIEQGASQSEILGAIAEHYQYAANLRCYNNINNSLFMNEVNTMLKKANMPTMPQGMLDHVAQRFQPDSFKKYFIDEYNRTTGSNVPMPNIESTPKKNIFRRIFG